MTLARRLAKLEKAAGKGERCAWCRLTLHTGPPDPLRRADRSRLVRCEFCGTEYTRAEGTPGPGDLMDRVGAVYGTFAPDDFYTDERARASWLWFHNWPWRVLSDGARGIKGGRYRSLLKLAERGRGRASEVRGVRADGSRVDRETAKARERRAAVAAEKAALERRARAARLKRYGRRFPKLESLKPRLTARVETWDAANARFRPRVEVSRLIAFAKLEKVIFGGAQAETLEALAHWRAEWAAEKSAVLEKRRGELRLAELNEGRLAAGLREFYSIDDAERTLKHEREEAEARARAERTAAAAPESAADKWRKPRESDEIEFINFGGDGDQPPNSPVHTPPGMERPRRAGVPSPGSEAELAILRKLAEFAPEYVVNDPTARLRLAADGRIVGPDGKPPETPDPARRYYDTERPAPSRRHAPGGSAPARRYRPRT